MDQPVKDTAQRTMNARKKLIHFAPVIGGECEPGYRTIETEDFPQSGFSTSLFITPEDAETLCIGFNTLNGF